MFREANMLAYAIAKKEAMGRDRLRYWDTPPQDVGEVLNVVSLGMGYQQS